MDSGTIPIELRGWQDCLTDCLQAPWQGGDSQEKSGKSGGAMKEVSHQVVSWRRCLGTK